MRNNMILLLCSFILAACGNTMERLSRVGQVPDFAKIELPIMNQELAKQDESQKHVRSEVPRTHVQNVNSLWGRGGKNAFRNRNTWQVGDIIKVVIDVSGSAKLDNTSQQTRSGKEDMGLPKLFGKENAVTKGLSNAADPTKLLSMTGSRDHKGSGNISRKEDVSTEIAAIVTQVLPNGTLMIQGHQEVRVNFELREVKVAGLIRPKDIRDDNSVRSEQIAEARISYGGRGHVSDVQQPRTGNQLIDILSPF